MPKIDIAAVAERKGSGYPPPFDAHADDHHPGRPGQCLRRRGTRQLGSRRHSCIVVGQSLEALEPLRQGVHGAIAPGVARGLKLRHDHGSNYMSGDFQDEIECLGIEASSSFVREPEGNGVAERFQSVGRHGMIGKVLRTALVEFASPTTNLGSSVHLCESPVVGSKVALEPS